MHTSLTPHSRLIHPFVHKHLLDLVKKSSMTASHLTTCSEVCFLPPSPCQLACEMFKEEETIVHRHGNKLKTHWCHVKPIGLTLVYCFGNGLITVREST